MTKDGLMKSVSNLNKIQDFLTIYFWLYIFFTIPLGMMLFTFLFTYHKSVKGKLNGLLFGVVGICLWMSLISIIQGGQYLYKRDNLWLSDFKYI